MKKWLIPLIIVVVLGGAGTAYYFLFYKNLRGQIVVPYIAHQKPRIDPHLPGYVPIADKLDEVIFDGLFNVSANPSGIVYEDGLGELIGIDENNVVTVRLKPGKEWHTTYGVAMDGEKVSLSTRDAVRFAAKDLKFTLRRIQTLGSLSPDFILVGQAVEGFDFEGPDQNDEIRFQFREDRMWTEADIKEVLSFKILPSTSELNAANYTVGTGPYMLAGEHEEAIYFHRNPSGNAAVPSFVLKPYIDNSTYTTELKNRNINTLLSTPFGAVSPLLADTAKFFHKSNIATTFFALFHNVERLSAAQRAELRSLVDNIEVVAWFFKSGTQQQRDIVDYKGNENNYHDYINYSIFPSTSYYVEEQVVVPIKEHPPVDASVLPDTIRIQTCLNYGYREELSELVEILNSPTVGGGRIVATAVSNQELAKGNYDAVLVPVSGYRSNFLFDLYDIFLREPDFSSHRINLVTATNREGEEVAAEESFSASKNFFRLDPTTCAEEDRENVLQLLEYIHGFMSTREVGDKQAYAQFIDELDQEMALGTWLFSLPSLAYFRTQFDEESIDLYGVASQLSTVEKWRESPKKTLF